MVELSIIVPVYNVELYLEKCLSSFYDNNLSEELYEVIVVDDGSPDSCLEISKQLQAKHSNMHIVSQPNGGLGNARNEGVRCAIGNYIWFVDSDDWITSDAISNILNITRCFSPEIINFDFIYSNGDRTPFLNNSKPRKLYRGSDYLQMSTVQNPVQYYIFEAKFYHEKKLSFIEGYYHEDTLFTLTALIQSSRVLYLDVLCYVHNIRENSIMTSGNHLRHAKDMIVITSELVRFADYNIRSELDRKIFQNHIAIVTGAIFYHWRRLSRKDRNLVSRELPFWQFLKPVLRSHSIKYIVTLSIIRVFSVFNNK